MPFAQDVRETILPMVTTHMPCMGIFDQDVT
jgi:hypothetical protein